MNAKAIVGIDPITHRCDVVGIDDDSTWDECREMGLIIVPTTTEICRSVFGEIVENPFDLIAKFTRTR